MAAVAFDTLKAARRLIAAGIPARQAEAQAEVMAEAFVFNMDKLVTQDYLDARLAKSLCEFLVGKGSSGTGQFKNAQRGSHLSVTRYSIKRSAGTVARMSSQYRRYTSVANARFSNFPSRRPLKKVRLIIWMAGFDCFSGST